MKFSIQLHGARNFQPWEDVLKTTKTIGYQYVEGFEGCFTDVNAFAAAMKKNGLKMPTVHLNLRTLEMNFDECIDIVKKLDIMLISAPWLDEDERPKTKEGWKVFAKRLAKIGKDVQNAGFEFAWHNHHYEFVPVEDGILPMDIILAEAPNIGWQADIAWIIKGKQNPADWIKKYGERILSVHAKDIAPEGICLDEDGWADLGHGTMPWEALFEQISKQTNAQFFVAEHDNPNDFLRFATRAFVSMNKLEVIK